MTAGRAVLPSNDAGSALYPHSTEIAEFPWLPWIMGGTDAYAGVPVGIVPVPVVRAAMRSTAIGFAPDTVGRNQTAARLPASTSSAKFSSA